jgi:micrococcal nuclease
LFAVSVSTAVIEPPRVFSESGTVVMVVDGDTIKVKIRNTVETIRLIGINTPETKDPRKPVECFGKEAFEHAKKLLEGKKVKLKSDKTQQNRDKYDRMLRYVWIGGNELVNHMMIADGYAFEYTYETPYLYQKEFQEAQKDAKEAQRGLWHPDTCAGELKPEKQDATPTPTATPKQNTSAFSCTPKKTCGKMTSCEEAYYHLNTCGNSSLDRDKDGIPCESICGN